MKNSPEKRGLFSKIIIFFRKLHARFQGKSHIRVGQCRCCGSCCRRVSLFIDGRQLKTDEEFENTVQVFPEYSRFYVVDTDTNGDLLFTCRYLGADNRCGDYENRPLICRRYPSPAIMKKGGHLMNHCGFEFIPVKEFRTVLEKSIEGDLSELCAGSPEAGEISDDKDTGGTPC